MFGLEVCYFERLPTFQSDPVLKAYQRYALDAERIPEYGNWSRLSTKIVSHTAFCNIKIFTVVNIFYLNLIGIFDH